MAKGTSRTGKLKRSKARKESGRVAAPTREASVGELVAALDGSSVPAASTPAASVGPPPDPDDLGLAGYEDDASQDLPPPAEAPPAASESPRSVPDGVELSDTLPMAPEDDLSRVRGQASPRLMSVVESLLFASDRPLTVRDIRRVLKEPTVRQVQLALRQLQLDTAARGVVLSQVAGGFRLRTNPANAQWVQKLLAGKPARLSRSQLEALAVVAYRQPITKAEVDHVRGVDCGAVLRVLLERDLVRIVGRKEEPGRPHLYGTTVEFLEFFNLRSLRDMPDLHEFRELTDESRAALRTELGEDADEVEAEVLGQEVLPFDGEAAPDPGVDDGEAVESAQGSEEAPAEATVESAEAREEAPAEATVEATVEATAESEEAPEEATVESAEAREEATGEAAEASAEAKSSEAESAEAEPAEAEPDPSSPEEVPS